MKTKYNNLSFQEELAKYSKDELEALEKEGNHTLNEMDKSLFQSNEEEKMEILNPVMVRPGELKPEDKLGFKVIAVIGYGGDWADYYGLTSWTDEEVATGGDKLKKEIAELLFYAPVAAGLKYRL